MTETFNAAIPGLGVTIAYSTTSGGSYTSITQVKSIGGTAFETEMADTTGLSSAAKEKVPTITDYGDLEFTVVYDPSNASHVALAAAQAANTLYYWKLTFPSPEGPGATAPGSAKTYAWAGYVSSFSTSNYEINEKVEATFKVSITGLVTPS